MKFSLKDFYDYYKIDANCYGLEVYQTPLTEKDFLQIVEKLKYYCKKDKVSFLAVFSTTASNTAEQAVEHTGKRGRPRKIVHGDKVDAHVHLSIVGTKEKSAYSTAQKVKKSIDKKYEKPVCQVQSKGNTVHAYNYIAYSLRQADMIRTGGDFDFRQYVATHDLFS